MSEGESIRHEAKLSGCYVATRRMDDGVLHYRFFTRPLPDGSDPDYSGGPIDQHRGVFTTADHDEARAFLVGFNAGKYADTIKVFSD